MSVTAAVLIVMLAGTISEPTPAQQAIRQPTGHKLLHESLESIARDYQLGWPRKGEAGHMSQQYFLCYFIPDTDTEIRFLNFALDSTSLNLVGDLPPFEKPPFVYAHFTMQQVNEKRPDDCETLRRSKAKDIVIGGFWIGQAESQARQALHELSGDIAGENCVAFDITVRFEPGRLGLYNLSDGNSKGPPYFIERYKTCLTFTDSTLSRLDIDASLLTP